MATLTIFDSTDFQEVEDIEDIKVFYRLLYKLNESTLKMSQATSMSELYRITIVCATSLLDIDRIGILMVDKLQKNITGTWGTDELGLLCNEYDDTSPIDQEVRDVIKLLDNQGKVCIWEDHPLYEFSKTEDTAIIVGHGWNGAIALWENEHLIGWIACDNLIHQRPFKPYISHILRLLGSIVSEYRLRFLAQEKIEKLNAHLKLKIQQLQSTIEILESTKQQLNTSQAHNAMKDLVVGVAHEINTPLGNAIMASSNCPVLLAQITSAIEENNHQALPKLFSAAQQTLDIIDRSLSTTASLITEFRRLSTIEIESIPPRKVILAHWLNEIINTISTFEPALKTLHIELNIHTPQQTIILLSEVLQQIFKELLFNSYLHAHKTENGRVNISIKTEHQHLHIRIEDNGPGIGLAMRDKIFNPFTTTERALGRKGLGLNVAANLVTFLLKGKLSYFDSSLGGAGFLIVCPVQLSDK